MKKDLNKNIPSVNWKTETDINILLATIDKLADNVLMWQKLFNKNSNDNQLKVIIENKDVIINNIMYPYINYDDDRND